MYDRRQTIFKDDTIELELEYVSVVDMYFIHVQCFKWNKSVYLHHLDILNWLESFLKEQGIQSLYAWNNKPHLAKYGRMFGWSESTIKLLTASGERLELLEWALA